MDFNKIMTKKGIIFLLLFSTLVFIGDKINFSRLIGADNQFFTLFQFFGPIAGYFLGPVVGILSVLIAEIASKLSTNSAFDFITILRLMPMLFAAWYFGTKKDKLSFLVPALAIIAFIAHPVGRQVWYFTLFWTIPLIIKVLPKKYSEIAFLRSLGATFTAHAVGGAIWNYIVPMTPQMWIALIPIVIIERLIFASGITISFIGFNTLLDKLDANTKSEYVSVDKKYVFFKHHA